MAIALRLGPDGKLQNFQVGETLQIDEIDRLGAGDLNIGASLGALDELIIGSISSLVRVLGDTELDGNIQLNDNEVEGILYNPANYTETADTLNGHLEGIDDAMAQNTAVFCIWAEESGGLSDGDYEWSYGNGDLVPDGSGIVIPFACEAFAMALDHDDVGSATVRFKINTTNGGDVTTTAQTHNHVTFGSPYAVAAGDVINFQTVTGPGDNGGNRVVVWLRANTSMVEGGVTGPNSSVDNTIARWDGTTGVALQGSTPTIDDEGNLNLNDGGLEGAETITFASVVAHGAMGTTETVDWGVGQKQSGTNSANSTISFTDPAGPCNLVFVLTNGGAFTLAWPAAVQWPGGTEPAWTAAGVDVISFFYDGTTYYGAASQNFS